MAALNTDHLALSVTTQPHSSKPHSRAEMVAQGASSVKLQNMAPNISRVIFAESLSQLGEATSIPCQAWNKVGERSYIQPGPCTRQCPKALTPGISPTREKKKKNFFIVVRANIQLCPKSGLIG